MSGPDLMAFSDCVVDVVLRVPRLPLAAWSSVISPSAEVYPGGMCTASIAARRLGLKVSVMDILGDDDGGGVILSSLRAEGVDTSGIRIERGGRTAFCVVLADPGMRHAFVGIRGIASTMDERDVDPGRISSSRALFLDGYSVQAPDGRRRAASRAMSIARGSRIPVFFDPGPAAITPGDIAEFLSADYVLLNEAEFRHIPRPLPDGVVYVVKMGRRGAAVYVEDTVRMVRAVHNPRAVTTVGAGDVFDAAFIWATLQGLDPGEAASVANLAASLKLSGFGPPSIPDIGEVAAVAEALGISIPGIGGGR